MKPRQQHLARGLVLLGTVAALQGMVLAQEVKVNRVYPDKARYEPEGTAALAIEIGNSSMSDFTGSLVLTIRHLEQVLWVTNQLVLVGNRTTNTLALPWTTPRTDFRGYLVDASLSNGSRSGTALDVSSDWKRYPRYGYVTEFYEGQSGQRSRDICELLARDYHINTLQFYDWMWRHENVIETNAAGIVDPWIDWRGARISYAVLTNLLNEAHMRNMAALPYFQIYCGGDNYQVVSGVLPQWGLFSDTAHASQYRHTAGGMGFWVFNPANTNWQNHLLGQYTRALTLLNWDGVHLDQLGNIGGGSYYDYNGSPVDLGNSFSPMLNRSKDHLEALVARDSALAGRDALTFNIVDGGVDHWGVHDAVHHSRLDFLYSELWSSHTYREVHNFVREERGHSGGKAMILAAYLNYDEENGGLFDPNSVRLADAVFFASGAFHLELGDGDWMAAKEFLPDRSKVMTTELKAAMRDYYNFSTAYESLLFAPEAGYGDAGLQWFSIPDQPVSVSGSSNAIWCLTRRTADYECVHLINLLGNDSEWRNVAQTPPLLTNLTVYYRPGTEAVVTGVYFASPDYNHGVPELLPSRTGVDSTGAYVVFTLPTLWFWDMIFIRRTIIPPPLGRYEAEQGIKFYVSVNNNYPGYSGSGFVDHFGSSVDSVSFFVLAPTDNDYSFQLRYANATGTDSARMLLVDGNFVSYPVFPSLPNWSTWGTVTQNVRLQAGVHQVVLVYITASSNALSFDYLQVSAPANGLQGEYFGGLNFTDPQLRRTDPNINFDWGGGAPAPGLGSDRFSVRWTGQVQPTFTEPYTFYATTDDGVRLWVNDQLLVDHWMPQPRTEWSGTVTLTAGHRCDLRMDYFDNDGDASAVLSWSSPSLPKQVLPAANLFPPGLPSTGPPPAPVGLSSELNAQYQAVLSWSAMPGATGYVVKRATDTNGPFATIAQVGPVTSFTNRPLPSGTWCFVITSLNDFGESPPSAVLTVQIPWTDTDGDGMSDADERFAGSNPNSAASVFRVLSIERIPAGSIRLTWRSMPGRTYRIIGKDRADGSTWSDLSTNIAGSLLSTSWVDEAATVRPQRVYRVLAVE